MLFTRLSIFLNPSRFPLLVATETCIKIAGKLSPLHEPWWWLTFWRLHGWVFFPPYDTVRMGPVPGCGHMWKFRHSQFSLCNSQDALHREKRKHISWLWELLNWMKLYNKLNCLCVCKIFLFFPKGSISACSLGLSHHCAWNTFPCS